MKPVSITGGRLLIVFCIIGLTLALVSWDRKQSSGQFHQKQQTHDTIPQKRDLPADKQGKKVRDLDEAIAELESVDLKIELDKAMAEANKAIKALDYQKIQLETQRAIMQEIDIAKMGKELKESIAKIDWDKIKTQMDEVKKIDFSEMEANLAEVKEEMKKIGPQLEKELQKAKVEIEKAKAQMKEYKFFVDGLEKDGLINKKENYSIKYKNGKLTINGKEASDKTYEKYRSFLDKHNEFHIQKDDDDFGIDRDMDMD